MAVKFISFLLTSFIKAFSIKNWSAIPNTPERVSSWTLSQVLPCEHVSFCMLYEHCDTGVPAHHKSIIFVVIKLLCWLKYCPSICNQFVCSLWYIYSCILTWTFFITLLWYIVLYNFNLKYQPISLNLYYFCDHFPMVSISTIFIIFSVIFCATVSIKCLYGVTISSFHMLAKKLCKSFYFCTFSFPPLVLTVFQYFCSFFYWPLWRYCYLLLFIALIWVFPTLLSNTLVILSIFYLTLLFRFFRVSHSIFCKNFILSIRGSNFVCLLLST